MKRGPKAKYIVEPGPNDNGLRERSRTRERSDGSIYKYVSYYTEYRDPGGKTKRKDFGTDEPKNRTGMAAAIRRFEIWRDNRPGRARVAVSMQVPAQQRYMQELRKYIESEHQFESREEWIESFKGEQGKPRNTPELGKALTDMVQQFDEVPDHLKPLFVGMAPFYDAYREFCDQDKLNYIEPSPLSADLPEYWAEYTDWVIEQWIKNPNSDAEKRLRFPGLKDAARKGGFPRTESSIRLDKIAEMFAADRQNRRGCKRGTVDGDVSIFRAFVKVVTRGQQGARTVDLVTEEHIERYARSNMNYAPATQRNRRGAVRRVLDAVRKRCKAEEKLQVKRVIGLLDDIVEIRKNGNGNGKSSQPKKLSRRDFGKLLKLADKRQETMILLAMNCAYSAVDICRLPVSIFDQGRELRNDREKREDPTLRIAVLWPRTKKAIREYQKAYDHEATHPLTGERLLFANDAGKVMLTTDYERSSSWFRTNIFNPLRAKAGLGGSVDFNNFRDSAYTLAMDTVDRDTAEILSGHGLKGNTDNYLDRAGMAKIAKACKGIEEFYFGKPKRKAR